MHRRRGVFALVAAAAVTLAAAGALQARTYVGGIPPATIRLDTPKTAMLPRRERTALTRRLAKALSVPHVRRSSSGALAIDIASGRVLYALHADAPLHPASNEKLATTYAALTQLGPWYRFRTQVLGTGRKEGHVWKGNVYLKGGGDPTLHTLALVHLAEQVRAAGITRITGRVLADESFFDTRRTAPGWKPSFYMDESPPLSALIVNRAMFHGQMSADPAGAAAALFTTVLDNHGVTVAHGSGWGTAPDGAAALAQIASQPLGDILRFMDHESDNFIAEQVLKTLGAEVAGKGTTAAGASVVVDALREADVPLQNVRIADGSGLSRLDRFTPRALASILLAGYDNSELRPLFWGALPVAGVNGTLAHRLERRPARGAIHAKTGTTELASALSGYVRRRYVFVIVQNGDPVSTAWAHVAQDRFATALAA